MVQKKQDKSDHKAGNVTRHYQEQGADDGDPRTDEPHEAGERHWSEWF